MKCTLAAATLAMSISFASFEAGSCADPAKASPAANLLGGRIDDLPIRTCVPISKDSSLVLSLPEHYWIRNVPTFDGVGFRLDYIPDLAAPGASCFIGVGVVPLPEVQAGEKPADRVRRAATACMSGLGDYWKSYFTLVLDSGRIKTEDAVIKIDGKKAAAFRSSRFNMKAAASTDRPGDLYMSECVAFNVEGTETLAFVVCNKSKSANSVDNVIANLSVQKNSAAGKSGRHIALIETSPGKAVQLISRLVCFEGAPGFLPNYTIPPGDARILAEDRVDEKGVVTGSLRITKRAPSEVSTPESEGKTQMSLMGVEDAGTPRKAEILTKGVHAVVYTYRTKLEERDAQASTGVFRLDDQVWSFTWYTFGDDAAYKADEAAFDRLLKKVQVATR